jgi:hypothetical protein
VRHESIESHKTEVAPDNSKAIRHALRGELRWALYRLPMQAENEKARAYCVKEAADQN